MSFLYQLFAFIQSSFLTTFTELYASHQVAGFVIAHTIQNDPRIAYLMERQIPFVSFGRSNEAWDYCWVDIDGCDGIQQVVAHLAANGHQHIAYLGWQGVLKTGQHREEGYRQGLCQANLPFTPNYLIRGEDSTEAGAQGVQQLLALPEHLRPTAIVCASDLIAVGALNAATCAGLNVGTDIAITGYDNVPMTELLNPPLTTVHQPIRQVGEHVVDLLLKQLQGEPVEQPGVLLKPELVVRASSNYLM